MQHECSRMTQRGSNQLFAILMTWMTLTACSGTPPLPEPQPVTTVDTVLQTHEQSTESEDDSGRLNVNIATFGLGIPEDAFLRYQQGVSEELREAESRYLPQVLKQVLDRTGLWGAVRVVPVAEMQSELLVTADIVESSGLVLALDVTAIDSTGRIWLQRSYRDVTSPEDYPETAEDSVDALTDPFIDLYHRIANDLLAVRDQMTPKSLTSITDIDTLLYARNLAPEAFSDYLISDSKGQLAINRLPARNDPILARINRVRDSEYRFIDTLDEHYRQLGERMQYTYYLLRKYHHDYTREKERLDYEASTEKRRPRDGLSELTEIYGSYQESKYSQAAITELASTFNSEFEPDVMQVADRVVKLSGSIEDRYYEWRQLLREIWSAETGLTLSPP